MPVTTAAAATRILDLLASVGADPIVGGGWGIDALIGAQTREHADLDVSIDESLVDRCMATLSDTGFVVTVDWRPVRVALTHPDGSEVDLHPVADRIGGTLVQQGFDGVTFELPASELTTGTIAGRTVRCTSAALQMRFHDGYEPGEIDITDCRRLAEATGAVLPPTIARLILPTEPA